MEEGLLRNFQLLINLCRLLTVLNKRKDLELLTDSLSEAEGVAGTFGSFPSFSLVSLTASLSL